MQNSKDDIGIVLFHLAPSNPVVFGKLGMSVSLRSVSCPPHVKEGYNYS